MRNRILNQHRLAKILGVIIILSSSAAISGRSAQPSLGTSSLSKVVVDFYPMIKIQDKQCVPAKYCYRNRDGRLICRVRERCRQCQFVRRCEAGTGCNWVERCRWSTVPG